MATEKVPKSSKKYFCEHCNYNTSRNSQYTRHLTTRKHIIATTSNILVPKNSTHSKCDICNKVYKDRSGLWRHEKKCASDNYNICKTTLANQHFDTSSNEINILTNLVVEMVKHTNELQQKHLESEQQNKEMQKHLIEVCKNNTTLINSNSTVINSNNNSNNKTFNLQFFLNEQCKDAMNISDFANSFDLQLSDLESVGELGYIEGITKIIVDKLNAMDIYKRPMHCSDAKREILYIKDEDKWEKEPRNNPRLRHAIKTVSFKSMKLTNLWSDTYPESKNGDCRLNDKYMTLIKESTGGNGEICDSENKIIKRIAKEIIIEKNRL